MVLGGSGEAGDTPDPLIGRGRVVTTVLPPDFSNDIVGLRRVADAELANHPRGFRLFAISLSPQRFGRREDYERWARQNPDKVPFDQAMLSHFRPVRSGWEALEVDVRAGIIRGGKPEGEIGVTVSFRDARNGQQPNPAPVNMPATEAAMLRLVRSFPQNPFVDTHGLGKVEFRLTQGGAAWWPRGSPEEYEHDFFTATAPRGRWLWWTEVKRQAGWEFIYVDAVTGAATSRCAEPRGNPIRQLVEIPCK